MRSTRGWCRFSKVRKMNGVKSPIYLVVGLALLAGTMLAGFYLDNPGDNPAAALATTPPKHLTVVTGIPYWEQTRAFRAFQDHVREIDEVSLFWYFLAKDGTIKQYADAQDPTNIITFAHQHGVKVLALIANLPEEKGTTWDWERVRRATSTSTARQRHVKAIVGLVERHGYDGINIDYETLRQQQTSSFTAFIRELASALHRRGKLLKVAIQPRTTNRYTNGQDWVAIARAVDQFSIMTYEEHWKESQPGPVASLPWVRRVLTFARSLGVPREKIWLGVPLYGYDWPQQPNGSFGTARGLEYEDVLALDRTYQVRSSFAFPTASPHFSYARDDQRHEVWYENNLSFTTKLILAREFQIGGITLWRLAGEDQRIWSVLGRLNPK